MKSGELGAPRLFEAIHAQTTEAPNIRLSKDLDGGAVGDLGIYCLNAARYIIQEEPTEVSAFGVFPKQAPGDERFKEVHGHTSFSMKFPGGALAVCVDGFDCARSDRFRITCEKGFLQMEPAFGYVGQTLTVYNAKEKVTKKYDLEAKNHFRAEMDHFSRCVLDGKQLRTPGEEGLKDIRVIVKIRQSMDQAGAVLKI